MTILKYSFAVLLLIVFMITNTGFIMGQKNNESSSSSRTYMSRKYAHGDYSKLKLIVRSRKTDYNLGEQIWVKFYVRNDSDNVVTIKSDTPSTSDCAHLWKIFHSNYDEVVKTPEWEKEFQEHKQGRYGKFYGYIVPGIASGPIEVDYRVKPGQEVELDWKCLNKLYDLSKPDTYELTGFTTSVILAQHYTPPLQSNTLTFRVLEEPVPWGDEDGPEPQNPPYMNPPPGEEVFKQPKPPKSVFYIDGKESDISPYEYYNEKAKAAEKEETEKVKE